MRGRERERLCVQDLPKFSLAEVLTNSNAAGGISIRLSAFIKVRRPPTPTPTRSHAQLSHARVHTRTNARTCTHTHEHTHTIEDRDPPREHPLPPPPSSYQASLPRPPAASPFLLLRVHFLMRIQIAIFGGAQAYVCANRMKSKDMKTAESQAGCARAQAARLREALLEAQERLRALEQQLAAAAHAAGCECQTTLCV